MPCNRSGSVFRAAIFAGLGIIVPLGGHAASAAVVLPQSGGSGLPDGNGAGFPNDVTHSYEVYQTTTTSAVETVTVPEGGGITYDLKFYITTAIYKDFATNPLGTIDLVYQLHNISDDNGSTTIGDTINRLTVQSFVGYNATGDYEYGTGSSAVGGAAGHDAPPIEIDRSTTPGSVVGFNFNGYDATNTYQQSTLIPNSFSDFLVVRTNATGYTTGTASVIGGLSEISTVTVPFGVAVPEPTSCAAVLAIGAGLLRRRRRTV